MSFPRASGILLHPTSLPGRFGVGDLGGEAYRFVDWLAAAGQAYWQIMPLGPTGYGDSPYSAFSAFAGNTTLVSPELLVESGLLDAADIQDAPALSAERVEYGKVIEARAISGHTFLLQAAVQAARQARFTPALLSGQPVKIKGTINYVFTLP